MGKPTGFMEYTRQVSTELPPKKRIQNFNEFHVPLHRDEQQIQGARCMDCGVPFCQSGMMIGGMASGCPLNNLIPEWNDLVYQGKWELALHRLMATNRFPEFTSRVCPALCEAACTCGMATGSPVAVKENERAIIEYGYASGALKPTPPPTRTGKTVAVVGSGPSGLSVADLLNKRGHTVTVFERADRPGGLLMYGIPNMKLEKSIIARKVDFLEKEGVTFRTGVNVGADLAAEELLQSFDAVVLCCGAKQARDIDAPGRDAGGIYYAVDYLSSVTKSLLDSNFSDGAAVNAQGKKVLVIGGGDTGNDCVGTAIRQGCSGVTQLEMMPCPPKERTANNTWPEWPRVLKTDYGQQEAIAVFGSDPRLYQTTVKEFLKNEAGAVCGAVISKLESKVIDEVTGRRAMVPTGEEFTLECDLVLIAAGFTGCQSYVSDAFGVDLTRRGCVAEQDFATSVPHVFACGDMRRGQSLVVWAIREGRDAAASVDRFLMGYSNL
jgi:glutamate synthase (NADPH/NADH) small chain